MKVTLINYALPEKLKLPDKGICAFNMKVETVNHEFIAQQAAAICIDKLDSPTEKGMMSAVNSGHHSIIEHLPLTWIIEDVSRALTHQLVRHQFGVAV